MFPALTCSRDAACHTRWRDHNGPVARRRQWLTIRTPTRSAIGTGTRRIHHRPTHINRNESGRWMIRAAGMATSSRGSCPAIASLARSRTKSRPASDGLRGFASSEGDRDPVHCLPDPRARRALYSYCVARAHGRSIVHLGDRVRDYSDQLSVESWPFSSTGEGKGCAAYPPQLSTGSVG
jgi:hypothetical protein